MLARSPPSSSKAASPSLPRAVLLSPGKTPPATITAAENADDDTDENVAAVDHFDDPDRVDKGTLKTTTVHIKESDGEGDTVTKRIEMIPMALLLPRADNNTAGGHEAMNGSSGGDAAVSGDSGDPSVGLVRNGGEVVVGGGADNRRPPPDERTPLIQQDIRGR
jgi:hypothetical protein